MVSIKLQPHAPATGALNSIIQETLSQVLPEPAVENALRGKTFPGKVVLVAIGKAAWRMAKAAQGLLGPQIANGIVITKYDHVETPLDSIVCREAGHPVPDANSYAATEEALALTQNLQPDDTVLFLVSGGGSALFEKPAVSPCTVEAINKILLEKGASITEINTVRKRLSRVKAGRFALHCAPARIFQVVLSDVLGDRLDTIASGPAAPDFTTTTEALSLLDTYAITLTPEERNIFSQETPPHLDNVDTVIAGGVTTLCQAAAAACAQHGYRPVVLGADMCGEAKQEGAAFAQRALDFQNMACISEPTASIKQIPDAPTGKVALIIGGETVVHVTGTGLGGRNQEFALAAAKVLAGSTGITIASLGSDGTDSPTNAAGGFATGATWQALAAAGVESAAALANNDAYHALAASGNLIITGPTGTNVNDVAIALIDKPTPPCG